MNASRNALIYFLLSHQHEQANDETGQFGTAGCAGNKCVMQRKQFFCEVAHVVPWGRLQAVIEPHFPKNERVDRPPSGSALMPRMYLLHQWFGLNDDCLGDAFYESSVMHEFLGIKLSVQDALDATTVLKFRRLLETHSLTMQIFESNNAHLSERGLLLKKGTLIDATIIPAAPTNMNKQRQHAPQMHQANKGKRVQLLALPEGMYKTLVQALDETKAWIGKHIEPSFHVVKNVFKYTKARCKGLTKNAAQLMTPVGLANLARATVRSMAMQGIDASSQNVQKTPQHISKNQKSAETHDEIIAAIFRPRCLAL
jgi:IS5 family transposase